MAAQIFDFGFTGQKGIFSLVRAKGLSLTAISALMLVLLLLVFFALLPFRVDPELLTLRVALVISVAWIVYFYARTVIRFEIDANNLAFQCFTRRVEISIDRIRKAAIYEFAAWGIGLIVLNSDSKRYFLFFWVAPFERDRRSRFQALIEHLRVVSQGHFGLKVST